MLPHLEFVVTGPPVSHQTTDRAKLKAWQAAVKLEAMKVWTKAPLTGKLRFLLINFHEGDDPPMDDDNMVKPIRDALNKTVYDDDRQIRYSETIQVSINDLFKIRRASRILFDAFARGDVFLYVRIEGRPALHPTPGVTSWNSRKKWRKSPVSIGLKATRSSPAPMLLTSLRLRQTSARICW